MNGMNRIIVMVVLLGLAANITCSDPSTTSMTKRSTARRLDHCSIFGKCFGIQNCYFLNYCRCNWFWCEIYVQPSTLVEQLRGYAETLNRNRLQMSFVNVNKTLPYHNAEKNSLKVN